MKKTQIDIFHNVETLNFKHPILQSAPKTPQQHFLLTYLALHFLNNNQQIQALQTLLQTSDGSFSQLLLQLKYMKKCMDKGALLDNPKFNVLKMLILWMSQIQKLQSNPKPNLVYSTLLPHPNQLHLHQYEELIIYFNYIGADIQKILKKANEVDAEDILELLEVLLPKVYYNVIIPVDSLGLLGDKSEDILFYNQSLEYVIRTNVNYRSLSKMIIKRLLTLPLKPNQMREMVERACRYYLLFHKDNKASTEIFLSAFEKATQAAKFSLTDELVLFFKVITKLGDIHLQKIIRNKYEWIDNILGRYGESSIVGHPKGEVNPFNGLGIKQSFYVGAGKTAFKNIQIYSEYSLLYFKADIQSYDISVKIYYLGEFESKVQVKKIVLNQEKISVQLRSAFIAAKKGFYMIEFDNSYSWIYGKNIKFQYVVLAQYKQQNKYPVWMKNLFEIKDTQKKTQTKATQKKQANIIKNQSIYSNDQVLKKEQLQTYNQQKEQANQHLAKEQQAEQIQYVSEEQSDEYQQQQDEDMEQIQRNQLKYQQRRQQFQQRNQIKELQHNHQINQQIKGHTQQQNQGTNQQHNQIQQKQQQTVKISQEKQIQQTQHLQPIQAIPQQIHRINSQTAINQTQKVQEQKFKNEPSQVKQQTKQETMELKSSASIKSESQKIQWGQANLSLIDNIFSLLVNQVDHTYEFETNLEDRIIKRLKSYCDAQERLTWIFNSQARDWLKKHSFITQTKNGITVLHTQQTNSKEKIKYNKNE